MSWAVFHISVSRLAAGFAFSAMLIISAAAQEEVAPPPDAPEGAVAVAPWEIMKIFSGKTWKWPNGAGYFSRKPRRFQAYVWEGTSGSTAEGRWTLENNARLCLNSRWETAGSSRHEVNCFDHVRVGNKILQRKNATGAAWYDLYTTPVADSDEAMNLVGGDMVTPRIKAILTATPSTGQ